MDAIRSRLGLGGRPSDDSPFVVVCLVAGLVAFVFLGIVLFDAYRQWRAREPLRLAVKDAKRKRAIAAAKKRQEVAPSQPVPEKKQV